ncbi:YdcF family protein [Anaerocolumna sp. AGMB13020]|uniref:YdcF family protein n=1 Tax=Anaerocolumna sp. AGMB13020 TaxID=3081750 RepID=UPI002952EAB2|nr:YdcF family protein [Anaerocolumna sp. AGMB13020]WOO38953.1 YdcF family protein [Anaerocolumna sp. AGMB13020]
MLAFALFFLLIFLLCGIYFFVIVFYSGLGTAFLWFWPALGGFCLLLSISLLFLHLNHFPVPKLFRYGFLLLFITVVGSFTFAEGSIWMEGKKEASSGADYVIVLGAQVKGTTVSRALKNRLDTALAYLKDNPESFVIVAGGQGKGEDITEALAMKEYLVASGADSSKILLEDTSVNTYENLRNSKNIIVGRETGHTLENRIKIVVVTNQFHVYRAVRLAKQQGFEQVSGFGAPNDDVLTVHYYVREYFGVVKDTFFGNMRLN